MSGDFRHRGLAGMNATHVASRPCSTSFAAASASNPPEARAGIDVIIPFYRNDDLVGPLCDSLVACAAELRDLNAAVVVINDSPGHEPLAQALQAACTRLGADLPVSLLTNEANIGFVRSCNRGLSRAANAKRHALLLNSDTIVFPGAFREMTRVADLDPMIGFVSPRSNNATIASLPVQVEFRHQSPAEAFASFRRLSAHLPEFHYVPTGVGFCLLVKQAILQEFGLLDEAYGAGYNEENDLVMRANRCGYRAVLANRAFVYHHGETSFSLAGRAELERHNARRLAERYPEYPRAVEAYVGGPVQRAESLLTALLPDAAGRHDVLFDFSDLGSYHNGTIEAAAALLREFVATKTGRFNLFVLMHAEHARFHGLDRLVGVQVLPVDTDRTFAVGLRIGQPFTVESYQRLNRLAARIAWFMLDSITWDCLALVNPDLDWIWRQVFQHADAIIYNSEFTRGQFACRFPAAPAVRHLVSPHSLNPAEYLPAGRRPGRAGEHILVVGNRFPHKHVGPAVDEIVSALPAARIECVGLSCHPHPLVRCHTGGHLSAADMESLYERASVVVFPSHYEGFGFPVLKALAYQKPILVRATGLFRDVRAALGDDPNIVLCGSTAEMAAVLRDTMPTWQPAGGRPSGHGWRESGAEIAELLDELIEAADPFNTVVRRLPERRVATEPHHPQPLVDPRLPSVMQRIRSAVIQMPVVRTVTRPLWRLVWSAWRPLLAD